MAKEIILVPGRTFSEFSLLPGYTKKIHTIENINLETILGNLHLRTPMLSAAMMSVTGYEMALALGKEGGLGVLPARLEDQAGVVKKIKNYEMGFVEDPLTIRDDEHVEGVLRSVRRYGHSKIPVINRNNEFLGIFDYEHYLKIVVANDDLVTKAMISFKNKNIPYINNPHITVNTAKKLLEHNGKRYLVVLDKQNRLVKLSFKKDEEKIKVASAISTHEGWKKRVDANLRAGVDLIVIDTSDAYGEYPDDVISQYTRFIKGYKSMGANVPICAGNVVTYNGALHLMKMGADIVKVGMSSGSICITEGQKAVGRAPMTALMAASDAQKAYFVETKRYVPIIMDGGLNDAANMGKALALADAIMMGNRFNRFYEAAGPKYAEDQKTQTHVEDEMRWGYTWGEGSNRAKNLDRYGHSTFSTFFPEGKEGWVRYEGRLKPAIKDDLIKIKAAMCNAGCINLEEFRREAVLELNSDAARGIVSDVHSMIPKE